MNEYKHYLRLDTNKVDFNGHKTVIMIYCENVNGVVEAGDILLDPAQLHTLSSQIRQARMEDYIVNYDSSKIYVYDENDGTFNEYVQNVSEYGEEQLDSIKGALDSKIALSFMYMHGTTNYIYLLDKAYKTVNLQGLEKKAQSDPAFTELLSLRTLDVDANMIGKVNISFNATELIDIYNEAFDHIKLYRSGFNQLENDVWASANKAEVDVFMSTFTTDFLA